MAVGQLPGVGKHVGSYATALTGKCEGLGRKTRTRILKTLPRKMRGTTKQYRNFSSSLRHSFRWNLTLILDIFFPYAGGDNTDKTISRLLVLKIWGIFGRNQVCITWYSGFESLVIIMYLVRI